MAEPNSKVLRSASRSHIPRVVVVGHHTEPDAALQIRAVGETSGIWTALAERGVDVMRICPAVGDMDPGPIDDLADTGVAVLADRLSPSRPPIRARFPGIHDSLARLKPGIVHVLGEPWQSGVASTVEAARDLGIKVGVHFAENGPGLAGAQGLLKKFRGRKVVEGADYLVGWSDAAASLVDNVWGSSSPTTAFPAVGIPADFFEIAHTPPSHPTVAFVGRFSREKGIDDFLQVARRLRGYGFHALVVGGGEQEHLVKQAAEEGIVEHVGTIERSRLPIIFARTTVTVVPSIGSWMRGPLGTRIPVAEQFGRVVVESLATGTPVVGYQTGSIAETLGPGGLLVPQGAVDELANAIVTLVADRQRYARAAAEGRAWAQRFSDESLAQRLIDVWETL
ncbi:MAG: glycosyltransferase family 4 protein [Actinomycetota bacterium]